MENNKYRNTNDINDAEYHYTLILQEKSPKACKELGRAVQGFDSDLWDASLRAIVFHGNLGKFQADIGFGIRAS